MSLSLSRNLSRVDQRERQARHGATWASGDYAVVGNALQIASEELCETVNLCQEERVLDVAAGNFHASLAAARRWCDVTATDHASDLTSRSRQRDEAASMGVRFVDGDAESLPFVDQSFSAVISAFGAMFAADQERAASEMIRVCRRGRRLGLANWTPDGFIGQLFVTVARLAPSATGGASPFAWGTVERLEELFGVYGNLWVTRKQVTLRARTPMDWVDKLRATYAPVTKAFAQLDAPRQKSLRGELLELVTRFNRAGDATMVVDADYLEVVVTRR
ncbi:MAG TPA: methyltransferase domain-containing protein [Steroidobacteraceae bacterium]|nr:methyltransferase domain-containing protein [Steroidobacteraceae bacterium]